MVERRVLPEGALAALVTGLRDLRWSWDAAEIDGVAERFGWRVDSRSARVIGLDVGFGFHTGTVEIDKKGRVERLHVAVCTPVPESNATWLRDVFATTVAAATSALGEPTSRVPGGLPEVWWRNRESTVGVVRMSVQVDVFLAANTSLDDFGRAPDQEW